MQLNIANTQLKWSCGKECENCRFSSLLKIWGLLSYFYIPMLVWNLPIMVVIFTGGCCSSVPLLWDARLGSYSSLPCMVQNFFILKSLWGQVFLINSAHWLDPVIGCQDCWADWADGDLCGPQELTGLVQPWFRWGSFSCCCLDEFPGRNSNHSANVMFNSSEETTLQIIWWDNRAKLRS